jgi:hypothetical protein
MSVLSCEALLFHGEAVLLAFSAACEAVPFPKPFMRQVVEIPLSDRSVGACRSTEGLMFPLGLTETRREGALSPTNPPGAIL